MHLWMSALVEKIMTPREHLPTPWIIEEKYYGSTPRKMEPIPYPMEIYLQRTIRWRSLKFTLWVVEILLGYPWIRKQTHFIGARWVPMLMQIFPEAPWVMTKSMQPLKGDFLVGHISLPITKHMPDMIMRQRRQVWHLMQTDQKIRRPTILVKKYFHRPHLPSYGIPMPPPRNSPNWDRGGGPPWPVPYIIMKAKKIPILNSRPILTSPCLFMIGCGGGSKWSVLAIMAN